MHPPMDQFHRDVLQLLRFSLDHPPGAAPLIFPMFRPDQIRGLYEIPRESRERIWRNRQRPEYLSLFESMRVE